MPVLDLLASASLPATTFPIVNEPTTDDITRATTHARVHGCDFVIGLGGGSALDSAKAVAALLTNPGDLHDYLEVVGRAQPLPNPAAPCIAIPTTAGTGSEVTRNAVVGVWLGRPDDAATFVQGGGFNAVAPLWNEVMRATLQTLPRPEGFGAPSNGTVIQAQICADTGTLPPSNCTSQRSEYFLANQPPPPATSAFVQQVAIDSWTGLRSNDRCPDNRIGGTFVTAANQVIANAAALRDISVPLANGPKSGRGR